MEKLKMKTKIKEKIGNVILRREFSKQHMRKSIYKNQQLNIKKLKTL